MFWLGFNPHISLTRMSQVYGDIITITFGSYTAITLNSIESVRETLVKHSRVYAGRPQVYSVSEVRAGLGILFIDFCPKYERERKLTIRSLHRTFYQTDNLDSMLTTSATQLIAEFRKYEGRPFNPKFLLRLLATNIVLKCFFDADFEFGGEESMEVVQNIDDFTKSTSAVNLSDIIPWIQKLPVCNFSEMKKLFQEFIDMHQRFFARTKPSRRAGFPRNVTDALLDNLELYNKGVTEDEAKISEKDLVCILADLVGAAFETIANTLSWALMFVAAHPEWQTVLQSELDAVVGRSRLPCLKDRDLLPNVNAALHEVLRMSCVVPLSLPHSTMQKTELRGFLIPKGTFVFVNIWAIHHDPKHWTSPHKFNPRRFLDDNGNFVPPKNRSFLPFSTGGRSCIGERLARDEIFVFFAAILQGFRLSLTSNDNEMDFNGELQLTLSPKPYLLQVEER